MPDDSKDMAAKKKRSRKTTKTPTTLSVCNDCGAKCCHDLVMPIYKPRTPGDVDELKWELQYDTVRVFIRKHRWYRLIAGRCMYLDGDDRCTIYARRPRRCREMKPPECENFGDFFDVMIATPAELDAYLTGAKRRRPPRRARGGENDDKTRAIRAGACNG